jgi:type I restriction enzyme M protein
MNADIRQKLDQITNVMWSGGLANPITYVEQLSYLIYLKLLDEAENQHQQVEFVGDEVFSYMASLVREAPAVATYFADARFQFEDAHVFKEVVDILDSFEFAKLGPDVKGDSFEYQLN